MSIKTLVQPDPTCRGQSFGLVNYGNFLQCGENGNKCYYSLKNIYLIASEILTDVEANEALVLLLVGYRQHWKIPIAWFLIKGLRAGEVSNFNLQYTTICVTCFL
jgi:hypothetical protein